MHKIEIADDTADLLFRDMLVTDYRSLKDDIRKLQIRINNGEELSPYELEDMSDWIRWADALEILLEYYTVNYEEIIAATRLT